MVPALIGAAAAIGGGILQNRANKKANQAAEAAAQRQYEQQKEFAQSGIQWKVQDAEKAGIHPLFALGANTVSYSPQSVGSTPNSFDFVGQAGQNIGRAIDSTRSTPAQALALEGTRIQIEGLQLDNELKRAQLASSIATARQTSVPGIPDLFQRAAIPGQGDSTQYLDMPGHEANTPQYTQNVRIGGKDIQTNPGISDASAFQDRYGEPAEWLAAPIVAAMDYWHNVRGYSRERVKSMIRSGKIKIRPN